MRRRQFVLGLAGGCLISPRSASGATDADLSSVVLAAVGDTVLGANLQVHYDQHVKSGVSREALTFVYFAGVKRVLESSDLIVANLEFVFTERGKKIPKNFNFRARPAMVEILKRGGVGVVTLANNHTMDYGPIGLKDTLRTLDQVGIARFGAGLDLAEARGPAVLERKGLRLGFLGYYFQDAADMREPRRLYATRHGAGVAGCYVDLDCVRRQVTEDVQRVASRVNALIPYFHWGREGATQVRDYQIELAHLCIDLGCTAVLGAHPHVLQGVEVYRGAPIFYSLGNFVYGGAKDPRDRLSAIALLRIAHAGVTTAELVPIHVTRWPDAPFQPFLLEAADRESALMQMATRSRGFQETLPMLRPYLEKAAVRSVPKEGAGVD